MPKIYEEDIVKAGKDPAAAQAWASKNGVEWVPSAASATWGFHPYRSPMDTPQALQEEQQRRDLLSTMQNQSTLGSLGTIAKNLAFGSSPGYIGDQSFMSPAGKQLYEGVALPQAGMAIGGALGGPWGAGIGGVAGSLLADVRDYAAGNAPSIKGIATRAGINFVGGTTGEAIAQKFRPQTIADIPKPNVVKPSYPSPGPMPPEPTPPIMLEPPTAPIPRKLPPEPTPLPLPEPYYAQPEAMRLGSRVNDASQEILGRQTALGVGKRDFIKEIANQHLGENGSPLIDARPLIQHLRNYYPEAELVASKEKQAAQAYMNGVADRLEQFGVKQAATYGLPEVADGIPAAGIHLDEANAIITGLGDVAYGSEGYSAIKASVGNIRREFQDYTVREIRRVEGPAAADKVLAMNKDISSGLSAAEGIESIASKDPSTLVRQAMNVGEEKLGNPDVRKVIAQWDARFNDNVLQSIDDIGAKQKAAKEALAKVKSLNAQQKEAYSSALSSAQAENEALSATHGAISSHIEDLNKSRLQAFGTAQKEYSSALKRRDFEFESTRKYIDANHAFKVAEADKAYQEAVQQLKDANSVAVQRMTLLMKRLGFAAGYALGVPGTNFPGERWAGGVAGSALAPALLGDWRGALRGVGESMALAAPFAAQASRAITEPKGPKPPYYIARP